VCTQNILPQYLLNRILPLSDLTDDSANISFFPLSLRLIAFALDFAKKVAGLSLESGGRGRWRVCPSEVLLKRWIFSTRSLSAIAVLLIVYLQVDSNRELQRGQVVNKPSDMIVSEEEDVRRTELHNK
jgi:hypothetical protein